MSTELINRVSVRWDGVYLSSHSDNDDRPFQLWHSDSLTEVYLNEGQKGLDREMIKMFYEYASACGFHPSMERYRAAMNSDKGKALYSDCIVAIDEGFYRLSPEDSGTIHQNPTPKAQAFLEYARQKREEVYTKIAELCSPIEKSPMRNHDEKAR